MSTILKLEAENFKRLKVVSITPDGKIVQVTGKNMQGKTSVLDCILAALQVKNLNQDKPIREGQERGFIRLSIGDKEVELVVERKFKLNKVSGEHETSVTVSAPGGMRSNTPATLIEGMLSSLTFDPLAFMRMKPEEQVKAVKVLLPGLDFDGTAAMNKADYENRTELNRSIRDLDGELKDAPSAAEAPAARVDKTSLLQKLTEASTFNSTIEAKKANRAKLRETLDTQIKWAAERQEEIVAMQASLDAVRGEIKVGEDRLAAAPPLDAPRDAKALSDAIAAADTVNAKIDRIEAYQAKRDKRASLQAEADGYTKRIEKRSADLAAAVVSAKLPVDGLSFGQDQVMLNNLPLNQASGAEQLRTSIAIAMSLNPKLKVIRVREGSLLDDEGMAMLAEMADKNDYQIWVERVSNGNDGVGFILEDGHVKGQEIEPQAEEAEAKPKKGRAKGGKNDDRDAAGEPVAAAAPAEPVQPVAAPVAAVLPAAPQAPKDDGLLL